MPAAPGNAGCRDDVAQAQLNFVRRDQCHDQIGAGAAAFLRNRERRRKIAARMRGVEAKVIIVVIEIPDERAVDKRRERA